MMIDNGDKSLKKYANDHECQKYLQKMNKTTDIKKEVIWKCVKCSNERKIKQTLLENIEVFVEGEV